MNLKSENMILDLLVQTDAEGIVELESTAGRVRMIPFSGTVTGPLFQGRIEPCGVDTQITNAADVRHMSARYMLTGVDHTGSPCHIYVQNEAWFTDGARPGHGIPSRHSSRTLRCLRRSFSKALSSARASATRKGCISGFIRRTEKEKN